MSELYYNQAVNISHVLEKEFRRVVDATRSPVSREHLESLQKEREDLEHLWGKMRALSEKLEKGKLVYEEYGE